MTGASLLTLIFLALFVPTTYQKIKVVFFTTCANWCGVVGDLLIKLTWSGKTMGACFLLATFGLVEDGLHNSFFDSLALYESMSYGR